jgi:hypothetical protein
MPRRKPSASQIQALEDVRDHGDPWARVHGQSQHGGWSSVMGVLERKKWVTYAALPNGHDGYKLTPAGQAVLEKHKD